MTPVVVDASAGAEIVARSRRGRALARLLPSEPELWVPEHFYAEVLTVIRRRLVIDGGISEAEAADAVRRLAAWHLHRASVGPLVEGAWRYRHNMTAADALYVTLAEELGAQLLTADNRLASAPTFPASVRAVTRRPDAVKPSATGTSCTRKSRARYVPVVRARDGVLRLPPGSTGQAQNDR